MSQFNLFDTDDKKAAANDLVTIAAQMEMCEDPKQKKVLSQLYKLALIRTGITDKKGNAKNAGAFSKTKIAESKAAALQKIKTILDGAPETITELEKNDGNQFSPKVFIISMLANHKGMPMEVNLEHCDNFYKSFSGHACIKTRKSLFYQKQLKGYPSIEFGLIQFGLDLIKDQKEKEDFWQKYAAPYNQRMKS